MKIEIKINRSADSLKTVLTELIEDLESVSNDHPDIIDYNKIEVVIEY